MVTIILYASKFFFFPPNQSKQKRGDMEHDLGCLFWNTQNSRHTQKGERRMEKIIGANISDCEFPGNVVSWMMGKVHSIRGWLWCVDVCSGTWKVKNDVFWRLKWWKLSHIFRFRLSSLSHHCVVSFSFRSFGGLQKKVREWWMLCVFDDIWWSTQQKSATKTRKQRGKNARSLKNSDSCVIKVCVLFRLFSLAHISTQCVFIFRLFFSLLQSARYLIKSVNSSRLIFWFFLVTLPSLARVLWFIQSTDWNWLRSCACKTDNDESQPVMYNQTNQWYLSANIIQRDLENCVLLGDVVWRWIEFKLECNLYSLKNSEVKDVIISIMVFQFFFPFSRALLPPMLLLCCVFIISSSVQPCPEISTSLKFPSLFGWVRVSRGFQPCNWKSI